MKVLKELFKLCAVLLVLAVAGCAYFYVTRKEHFSSPADFIEELKGTLSELPMVALLF